jgi:hypothetical protein
MFRWGIGLRSFSGQLLDFGLHHSFDENSANASQQIAQAGLG